MRHIKNFCSYIKEAIVMKFNCVKMNLKIDTQIEQFPDNIKKDEYQKSLNQLCDYISEDFTQITNMNIIELTDISKTKTFITISQGKESIKVEISESDRLFKIDKQIIKYDILENSIMENMENGIYLPVYYSVVQIVINE